MSRSAVGTRSASVGLAAVVAVVMTASLAGAHGGDTDKIHGCVSSQNGSLRIVEPDEGCRKDESGLHWTRAAGTYRAGSGLALSPDNVFSVTGAPWGGLTGVPAGFADDLDDDGAPQLRAALGANDGAANESNDLVSFSEIKDLTAAGDGRITGSYITDGSIAGDDLADGSVTSGEISNGTITAQDLAGNDAVGSEVAGAVTSEKIFNGTIATADLATGAVTSGNIADGTIVAADLAAGAVTTARQTANFSLGQGGGFPGDDLETSVVEAILEVPAGSNHSVLLTGQLPLSIQCSGPCAPSVTYYIRKSTDGGSPVGVTPSMTSTVSGGSGGQIVLPVAFVDHRAGAGVTRYQLMVTVDYGTSPGSTATAVASSPALAAVDLGQAP